MGEYADQVTLGEGKFRARVLVEGWPEIFVSDASLVRTTSDGREQINGLDPQTIRIAASVDLMRAELKGSEQVIEIVDDSEVVGGVVIASGLVTQSLSKAPTNTTFLTADLEVGGTTIEVTSTDGFPSSDVVHLATEAIKYTGKTATTFTGLTRGYWDTSAQKHFVGDGERLAFPKVTDRPRTLRGRRVRIYLYGAADPDTSDGTLRWRAICRTDVSFAQGRYAFSIEPVSWLFQQPIGGDLEDPVPIRGIMLPSQAGFALRVQRLAAGEATSATTGNEETVRFSGFWATQEEFIVALNTALASATSGWTWDADSVLTAQSDGPFGWTLVYRCGSTNARWVRVYIARVTPDGPRGASPVDLIDGESVDLNPLWFDSVIGAPTTTVVAGQMYTIRFNAPVPRAVLVGSVTTRGPGTISDWFRDPGGTMEPGRVYVGGNFVPTTGMWVAIKTHFDADETPMALVDSVSSAERYVVVTARDQVLMGPQTMLRFVRRIARGHLNAFLIALLADSPGLVNSGAMPLITTGDLEITMQGIADATRGLRLATRVWRTSEGVSLGEILTHEARLIGVYPAPDGEGKIAWKRLRPALATDVAAITLDATSIVGAFPAVAKNASGHLREVVFRQGWDPLENEHRGLTIRVRDVQGADPTPLGGVLEIAPRSSGAVGDMGLEIDPLDAELLGHVVLGMFGGSYRTITLEAALVHFDAELGAIAVVTTPLIPDTDGSMGIVSKAGTIVGFDWSPLEGHGSLTVRTNDLNIGGYSPSVLVASQVNDTGNQWTLTVTLTGYTSQSDIGAWFEVGDEVRVIQRDSVSPTRVSGTVDTVPSTTSVQVTFDGTWTPGSDDWYLSYDTTANVDETAPSGRRWAQTDFAKCGGTDQKAALASGDVQAQDLSP